MLKTILDTIKSLYREEMPFWTEREKFDFLVSPEKFFPENLHRGILRSNKSYINAKVRHHNLLRESQYWQKERLEELQTKRLRNFMRHVTDHSPFWSKYCQKYGLLPSETTLADLSRLPVLRRTNLLELGETVYLPVENENGVLFNRTTGGTTGVPLRIYYSEHEMLSNGFALRHPAYDTISLMDLFSRKPIVVLGKPGNYTFQKDFTYKEFDYLQPLDLDIVDIRKEIYRAIRAAGPAVLIGFGSLIVKFAEWVLEDGISLPLLTVHTKSEPTSVAEREMIRKVLKAPVVNILGVGNGHVGFECPENRDLFHVNSENIILEIVGENGELLPDGEEGELVVTNLSRTTLPHIRFAHSDVGRILPEPCPCGRTLPLFEFHGRREHEILFPSGRRVRIIHFHNQVSARVSLGRISKQFQLIQNRIDNLRLLIVPKRPITDAEKAAIRFAFGALWGDEKMNVEIDVVEHVLSGRGRKPCAFIPLSEAKERNL